MMFDIMQHHDKIIIITIIWIIIGIILIVWSFISCLQLKRTTIYSETLRNLLPVIHRQTLPIFVVVVIGLANQPVFAAILLLTRNLVDVQSYLAEVIIIFFVIIIIIIIIIIIFFTIIFTCFSTCFCEPFDSLHSDV